MGVQMNIARAKAHLSELVALAEAGENVVIARDGKPAVTLRRVSGMDHKEPRKLGFWAHLGPLEDPYLFLRPDPEMELIVQAPIDPER